MGIDEIRVGSPRQPALRAFGRARRARTRQKRPGPGERASKATPGPPLPAAI